MKREFLQNFKVGDQPLPKDVIDAIMEENGRDIEAAKKPFADYDTLKAQLETAQKTIQGFKDQDIEGIRKSAQDWEKKYNDAVSDHQRQMADRDFNDRFGETVKSMHGHSVKAILGELGPEKIAALKESKNQETDIKAALEGLQKDSGYLFGSEETPPAYAAGTGTGAYQGNYSSDSTLRAAMGLPVKNN